MKYYIMFENTKLGPYTKSELVEKGLLHSEILVCEAGEHVWKRGDEYPDLIDYFSSDKQMAMIPDECPGTWIMGAILLIFVFFPLGVIILIYSLKVEFCYNKGKFLLAEKYSVKARKWFLCSLIIAIVYYSICFLLKFE